MKKFLFVLAAFAVTSAAFAEFNEDTNVDMTQGVEKVQSHIDTSQIPTGKWLDDKWEAEWHIEEGGIFRLYDRNGTLLFDFKGKMENMKVNGSLSKGVTISFSCTETQRDYSFRKGLSINTDLEMTIDNHATGEHYVKNITFIK